MEFYPTQNSPGDKVEQYVFDQLYRQYKDLDDLYDHCNFWAALLKFIDGVESQNPVQLNMIRAFNKKFYASPVTLQKFREAMMSFIEQSKVHYKEAWGDDGRTEKCLAQAMLDFPNGDKY